MIDLHSHILPGIDDGAKSLDISLEMARLAVADGIHTMACSASRARAMSCAPFMYRPG